jgi:hypothetical protein
MRVVKAGLSVLGVVMLAAVLNGAGGETLGAGVTIEKATPLATVLARPEQFEGKTIRVEGVVTAVCEVAGCWMALAPDQGSRGATLRFKVEDGVIVFPLHARGRRASAQGVVERIARHDAHGHEAAAEHAHQEGRTATARAATQWHVRATGAVLRER